MAALMAADLGPRGCHSSDCFSIGGGASDVRQGGDRSADRVVVGAGGGGTTGTTLGGNGGAGGGDMGGSGGNGRVSLPQSAGPAARRARVAPLARCRRPPRAGAPRHKWQRRRGRRLILRLEQRNARADDYPPDPCRPDDRNQLVEGGKHEGLQS